MSLLAAILALVLCAADSQGGFAEELARARTLAASDLGAARAVLDGLARGALDAEQQVELALARARLLGDAARRERDPAQQLALFAEAEQALALGPDAQRPAQLARFELALATAHAAALEQAGELADAGRREELQSFLSARLERALAHSANLALEAGPELDSAERAERWRAVLSRAQLLLGLARVRPERAAGVLDEARSTLERVLREAGADSAPAWSARLALAQVLRARGEFAAAAEHARAALTRALPEDARTAEWQALAPAARAERFRLAELACPELVASLVAAGEPSEAARWALFFLDRREREGFALSAFGELARLSALRGLGAARGCVAGASVTGRRWYDSRSAARAAGAAEDELADVDALALAGAREVQGAHPGTILEKRARALVAELLQRPDARAPPEAFLAGAEDALETLAFARAQELLERSRRALEARADDGRAARLAEVDFALGRAFAGQTRSLEAARAYRAAAHEADATSVLGASAALAFYREITALGDAPGASAEIEALSAEAEELAARADRGALGQALTFRLAERAWAAQDAKAARARYRSLAPGAREYEAALVKAALCLEKLDDAPGAEDELRAYVDEYVPAHSLLDAERLALRTEALALARFALARLAAAAGRPQDALVRLEGYAREFAALTELVPNAQALALEARLARGELDAARAAETELAQAFAEHPARARAALALYRALEAPLAAAESAGELARARELALERAGYLRTANRTAREPSFVNLHLEATLWAALAHPAEAAESLTRLVTLFEGTPEHAAELAEFARPLLGRSLLALERTDEAFAALAPLVAADPARAGAPPVEVERDWCRAVTGWLAGPRPPFRIVPGARAAAGLEMRAAALLGERVRAEVRAGQGWSCADFELEFAHGYALARAAAADPAWIQRLAEVRADLARRLGGPGLDDLARYGCDENLRLRFLELGSAGLVPSTPPR
ncbi:MAG: hypothetical protein EXS08_08550 [Planctomycetes bacterium]|nr:hypothetical protein [Planctomycetota bacterium]